MLTHLMKESTSHSVAFQPEPTARLPLAFDVAPLVAEIDALGNDAWREHFNTGYHDGGWTGIPLLAVNGNADTLYASIDAESAGLVRATMFGDQCPLLLATIAQFHCHVKSARILRLASGSVIREHADADLLWCDGEARLHIPLRTNDRVEFYVGGRRIVMQAGECWYLDLSQPHRVQNLGATGRVHLVLDCKVNDWLTEQVQQGFAPLPPNEQQNGAAQFSRFRDMVFSDPHLQSALRNCAQLDELMAAAVALGKQRSLHFSIEDVRAQANRGRREWIEQWIV